MIKRHSSRHERLDGSFLAPHLARARAYRRIAGYFTSSLFEIADEELENVDDVRIVCNADMSAADLAAAGAGESRAMRAWNADASPGHDALLNRKRYQRLARFLDRRPDAIRLVPDEICGFVHGKAGVIDRDDGRQVAFIGSMNETRQGWRENYELLWEDDDPDAVAWTDAEFDYLWRNAAPLPETLITEIRRRAHRREVDLDDLNDDEIGPAVFVESPMTRSGDFIAPWQRAFVEEATRHLKAYGLVRLLLADEVGLGKTLSLGAAAAVLLLANERDRRPRKPAAIFAPAGLCPQWQDELHELAGLSCARWDTLAKVWRAPGGEEISPRGANQIARCPRRVGIISTGTVIQKTQEHDLLSTMGFDVMVIDEGHKMRRKRPFNQRDDGENNLMDFAKRVAAKSRHVLAGTATPVQTDPADLWDILEVLESGASFLFGSSRSPWRKPETAQPVLTGRNRPTSIDDAWPYIQMPLPPVDAVDENEDRARRLVHDVRMDLDMQNHQFVPKRSYVDLDEDVRDTIDQALHDDRDGSHFLQRNNPVVRHVVMRKRETLENKGYIPKISVNVHPFAPSEIPQTSNAPASHLRIFDGRAVRTSADLDEANAAAERFADLTAQRYGDSPFIKNIIRQRMCSSIRSARRTAKRILESRFEEETDDEGVLDIAPHHDEREELRRIIDGLARTDRDPKLDAVEHYLREEDWLSYGCIIFTQYYDTAEWITEELSPLFPETRIGLYAGAGKSKTHLDGESVRADRERLKHEVQSGQLDLVVSTDAACEGLNLQRLGTLINVDLPWNPTRLEQRVGRIKRYGQILRTVSVLNLVYHNTKDEDVHERISQRMKERYEIFGNLPDVIRDDWIEHANELDEFLNQETGKKPKRTGFDIRYNDRIEPSYQSWRSCTNIVAPTNIQKIFAQGW